MLKNNIYPAYVSKDNLNREKQITLLRCHYDVIILQ